MPRLSGGRRRLLASRESKLRVVADPDHETIRSHCPSGPSQRCDHVGGTGAVGRIYDYRQMGNSTNRWYRSEIERVSGMLGERANTSLAQDDVVIPFGHDVLGREQPFLECCSHSSLQQHRQLRTASPLEKGKVLHAASANLNDMTVLLDKIDIRLVDRFRDDL